MKVAILHEPAEEVPRDSADSMPGPVQIVGTALAAKNHAWTAVSVDDGVESVLLQLRNFGPDLVFHIAGGGRGRGRESLYPALFSELRLPSTGPDSHALGVTADKHLTKMVARDQGVPVPQGLVIHPGGLPSVQWNWVRLPAMVKPTFEEHSRGIRMSSICRTLGELQDRAKALLGEFDSILVEEFVTGVDVAVCWLEGAGDGMLPPVEMELPDESPIKHRDLAVPGSRLPMRCPARLSESATGLLRTYVRRLVRALGLRDLAQFDFRVTPDGVPFLLEVNALPSFAGGSMLLTAALAKGLSATDVVTRVCENAMKRRRPGPPAQHAFGKDRKGVRVGFVYNMKRSRPTVEGDHEAEWDPPRTITAIRESLERMGHTVIPLEATETLAQRLGDARVDVVFNIAEGYRGRTREAQVPALCDLLGIPHTGSDATTLSIAMDKGLSKDLFLRNGVPTPASQIFRTGREKLDRGLQFPLIAKPNAEGSSKGIWGNSVVTNEEDLRRLVKEAIAKYGQPVLVEQYIRGREFTVALLQTDTGMRVLPALEVVFLNQSQPYPVYSFEIKQDWDKNVRYDCPANIDKRLERVLAMVARKAFHAIGCRDFARVDIRMSTTGVPYVLEVNPLPGLTPDFSDMCLIANAVGMSYDELIGNILKCGLRRMRQNRPKTAAPIRPPIVQPTETQGELHLVAPG